MGLAMVVAALGTGCAVDAADADLEQAGLDEVEELDSTAAALEEGAEEERSTYQWPSKDLFGPSKFGPSKFGPSKKGLLGLQGPVDQVGLPPIGQLSKLPIGQYSQVGPGLQGLVGGVQGERGADSAGANARMFGCCPGFGFGFGGLGGLGGLGFGGFPVVSNNNNNNIVISQILDRLFHNINRDDNHHHGNHHCWP
jgi:hypothetical protein